MISPPPDDSPTDPDREEFENADKNATDDVMQSPDADFSPDGSADGFGDSVDELVEAREKALRLQAELENYRKRMQRLMDEERKYAGLPLMRDLLEVVDNLDRAAGAADQNEANAGLLEGVKIVSDQLKSVLQKHQCLPIDAEGQQFDPNFHEAIAHFPSEDHEPGTVSAVHQVGYRLHDRVVRPTQVIVAAPRTSADGSGASDTDAGDEGSDRTTDS